MFNRLIISQQLIGRHEQLEVMQRLVETTAQGQGACLLLSGEAGIGKSRLLTETKKQAELAGFLLLQGNCYETDRSFPYAPFIDFLQVVNLSPTIIEALGPVAHVIATLSPHLKNLASTKQLLHVADPEQEKRQLFAAFTAFFTQLASTSPLLLMIEDLHWCDDTSLEWLLSFYRHVPQLPILLLLTYRSDETTIALRHLLSELDRGRHMTELVLKRLTLSETQAMITAIFAQQKPIHPDFVAAIHRLTDGNPFFIEETLKSLVTTGDIYLAYGGWTRKPLETLQIPRSVEDAVQRRIHNLSQAARSLLQLTAVAGRRFDFNLLQALTNHDEPSLLALIKELMAAQLVVEESADRFAFRHALTRQAIYRHLLRREQRVLHQTIAQMLLKLAENGVEVPLADLAYHFFEAEQWEQAREYGRQAGEQAQSLFAPRAAVEQFTRALVASSQTGAQPAALYHARGQAYDQLGEFDLALADYEQAQRLAAQTGQMELAWQSLLNLGFLWVGQDYRKAGEILEQALALARQIDAPAILGQTLNRVGNWHLMTEREDLSIPYHQEALQLFQSLNDQMGMATSLDLLGISHFMHGDMVRGAAYYKRAIALYRLLGEKQWLVSTLASHATRGGNFLFPTAVSQPTPLTTCRAEAQEALQVVQPIDWLNGKAAALIWYGVLLVPRGEFAEALLIGQQGLSLSEELGHGLWGQTARAILGATYLELGAWEQAEQYLATALQGAIATGSPTVVHTMAGLYVRTQIAQGRLDEAALILDQVQPPAVPCRMQGHHHFCWAQIELFIARQTPSLALPLVAQMEASLDNDVGFPSPTLIWLRGEVLLAMERFKDAEQVLLASKTAAVEWEHLPILWRSWAALARLYQSRGRVREMEEAVQQTQAVVDILVEKTADGDLARALRRIAIAKLPQPSPRNRAASTKLTRREREVATLLAQGHTNAIIAETLVLSERTIEKHVENMMNKLGFNSRVQIAAWLVAQQ